jgi:hypothetical protein
MFLALSGAKGLPQAGLQQCDDSGTKGAGAQWDAESGQRPATGGQ